MICQNTPTTRTIQTLLLAAALVVTPSLVAAQTVLGTLTHAGMRPGAVSVQEAGARVLVGDSSTGAVYIYDAATNAEIGSVATGLPGVTKLLVDETRGRVWASCACAGTTDVAVIDAAAGALAETVTLSGAFVRLAKDETQGRIFATSAGGVQAIDAATYVVTDVPGPVTTEFSSVAVNPVTHEVFATGSTTLYVINAATLAVTPVDVAGVVRSIDLTVNTVENKVYIASDLSADVWVFDRDTGQLARLNLGVAAYPIAYDPASNMAVTAMGHIIDGATDAVRLVAAHALAVAVRGSTGHVYFADPTYTGLRDLATGFVEVFAVANPNQTRTGSAIAINQATGRVYVINDGPNFGPVTVIQDEPALTRPPVYLTAAASSRTYMVDSAARQLAIPHNTDAVHGLTVRPGTARVYATTLNRPSGQGSVQTFEGLAFASVDSGMLGADPVGIAVTPDGSRLYVARSAIASPAGLPPGNVVAVFDATTLGLITNVPVGTQPWGLALSPDGSYAYVANRGSDTVSVIATWSNTVTATVPVGDEPYGVATNPSGTKVYVANSASGTVSVIDALVNQVVATIPVGTQPHWLAASPDGRIWVTNSGSGTVSVIASATDAVVQTVTIGGTPEGIVAMPDGQEVWVGSIVAPAGQVHVIDTATYLALDTIDVPAPLTGAEYMLALAVADPTSRLAGRVSAASNGASVAGATVRARQGAVEVAATISDAAGNYSLFNLLPGVYTLEVSAAGFTTVQMASLAASTGRTVVRHVPLSGTGASPTTTTLAVVPNPATFGQPVVATATVTAVAGGTPTGTVSFTGDGVAVTGCGSAVVDAGGQAVCAFAAPAVGSHTIAATYSGSAGHLTSTSPLTTLVVRSPAAITSPAQATFRVGSAESFTVTATGSPVPTLSLTGTLPAGVTFVDNGNGTATLAGTAAAGSAGIYPLTITASNGVAANAVQAFALTVYNPGGPNAGKDFNNDGQSDLLWESSDGWVAAWLMNGTSQTQNLLLYDYPVAVDGWHIAGTGDFNGDGQSDILWQSDGGHVAAWMMDGTTQRFNQLLYDYPVAVGGWHIAAAGDLDGDGVSDIIWQDAVGHVAYWLMGVDADGYAYQRLNALFDDRPVAEGGWAIVGTGDLNGDGMTDLVWQSPEGYVAAWLMNGVTQVVNTRLYDVPVALDGWTVVGTADMNGDGMVDVLWQKRPTGAADTTFGYVAAWFMNGIAHAGTVELTPSRVADATWKVVGPK